MAAPQDKIGRVSAGSSLEELEISKRVDAATTALMSALRNNESIKTLKLTVRKSGGTESLDYFSITLEKARITYHHIEGGAAADSSVLSEVFRVGFQRITVEYQPQTKTGGSLGTMLFETDISTS